MKTLQSLANNVSFAHFFDICSQYPNTQNIPRFCQGTAFSFLGLELKLDINNAQWSPNCSIVVVGDMQRCDNCAKISYLNRTILAQLPDDKRSWEYIEISPHGTLTLKKADEKKKPTEQVYTFSNHIKEMLASYPKQYSKYIYVDNDIYVDNG